MAAQPLPPEVVPVVLSGGSGTRLWPLSLPSRPKQLQALAGHRTMIQDTVMRSRHIEGVAAPVVVCSELQALEIIDQLTAIGSRPQAVIVEPIGRNTAPAVAAAALLLSPETVMAVFPADHLITDEKAFRQAVTAAVEAARQGFLVTFGVLPTRPDTGFGYLEVGQVRDGVAGLVRFVEKPDLSAAERYVEEGYLWNSGMFVFTAGDILMELRRYVSDVVEAVTKAIATGETDEDVLRLGDEFIGAASISIDHAVMEKTRLGRVVPLDAGWSDVGSWQALWEAESRDEETVVIGDVYAVDVERSYVRAESRPVAVVGLDDVVVVETPEAVLVIDRRRAQEVRSVAEWYARITQRGEND